MDVSKAGRVFQKGKPIDDDLRRNICQDIIDQGGDFTTGFFPGSFTAVAQKHRVKCETVQKVWKLLCETGDIKRASRSGGVQHLQQDDIEFVQFLKTDRPSMAIGEVLDKVNQFCNVHGGTSKSSLQRTITDKMNDGKWSWKKLVRPHAEKFTAANVQYCQQYLNYIHTINPMNLKFFDESGLKLPDVGKPNYGHSRVGTPAVEIVRYMNSPNITLNLLCGLDGIIYANTIDGSSNSLTFLNFFEEASEVILESGAPAFTYGDHVILDNAPIHHWQAGQALGQWLDDNGSTLVYLPTYSPEFNPTENVFNKLKTILRRYEYRELLCDNLHVAVYEALKEITPQDIAGFFRHTGYIRI